MPRGDELWKRLESARLVELHKLGELIGLADVRAKAAAVLVEEISRDLRHAAGHSLLNLFRAPHAFPYKQLLIDVADKLAPGWTPLSWTRYRCNDAATEADVEETIWRFFEQRLDKKIGGLSPEQRGQLQKETEKELRGLGYSEALVAQIGAGLTAGAAAAAIAPALAYQTVMNTASGLARLALWWTGRAAGGAILGMGSLLFVVLYAPVLAWWLGNTAYRKTIPAALQLIQIRKLREAEAALG